MLLLLNGTYYTAQILQNSNQYTRCDQKIWNFKKIAQSAGAVEFTNCISAEG